MRHRFPDESRQNLGKIPEGGYAVTGNLARDQLNVHDRQANYSIKNSPNHRQPTRNSARLAQEVSIHSQISDLVDIDSVKMRWTILGHSRPEGVTNLL
jgi:hypothetical protein